jgi:hypothetical protein
MGNLRGRKHFCGHKRRRKLTAEQRQVEFELLLNRVEPPPRYGATCRFSSGEWLGDRTRQPQWEGLSRRPLISLLHDHFGEDEISSVVFAFLGEDQLGAQRVMSEDEDLVMVVARPTAPFWAFQRV